MKFGYFVEVFLQSGAGYVNVQVHFLCRLLDLDLPFSLEFVIRSFIRYFVIQGIVLDKLYLIKLRITNSKKTSDILKYILNIFSRLSKKHK